MHDWSKILPKFDELVLDEGPRGEVRGIGMSDLGSVLGLEDAFGTPLSLWRRLKGLDASPIANWHMQQGTTNEPLIVRVWGENTGHEIIYPIPRFRLRSRPHVVFSLDAIGMRDGIVRVVEAKYPGHKWTQAPQPYVCQVIGGMGCSGLTTFPGALVQATRFEEPTDEPVPFDADLFGAILEAVDRFWFDHVEADVSPEPTTPDERMGVALSKLRKGLPAVVATEEHEALALMVERVYADEKAAKARKEEMSARMAEMMALSGASKIEAKGRWSMTLVETPEVVVPSYTRKAGKHVLFTSKKEKA